MPTCLWHAGAGYKSRVRLIRLGWCSSTAANTKMLRLSGVACAAIGSSAMCRTDTGRRPRVCRTTSCANPRAQCRRHRQPPCAQSFLAPVNRSARRHPRLPAPILTHLIPIEMPFSKPKACLSRVAERTVSVCTAGSARSLEALPPKRPATIPGTQAVRKIDRNPL